MSILLPAFIAGVCLSAFFLFALRFTLEHGLHPRPRPGFLIFGFMLRMATLMAGMTIFCGSSPAAWIGCLAGFVCGRHLLHHRFSPEVAHAHRA